MTSFNARDGPACHNKRELNEASTSRFVHAEVRLVDGRVRSVATIRAVIEMFSSFLSLPLRKVLLNEPVLVFRAPVE
ncbi:hypothetical protein BRADI_4g36315v3 [Brachypodium distachyon]|uniref:Uncharacterized protein n=1 Tax=Brachypodium distachyon TaxID=15368 RepID=A0A0Q3HCJ7_BRADI|nr:hypothetical protein BRADI_4g36315v3 [Brachypodium distachyon]KQJ91219.1 hypothetical protein BRADI_4g36315v3 [Brachypodium distachyon]